MTGLHQPLSQQGYTLPVVLVLTAITAMLAGSALSEGTLNQALASTHELQQRANHTAEAALAQAVLRLGEADDTTQLDLSQGDTTVTVRPVTLGTTPEGFSVHRFVDRQLELHGSTRALRAVRARIVEGLGRVEPRTPGCDAGSTGAGALPAAIALQLARFSGSVVAIDTDADGRNDRIYAGDREGRLWRFDLLPGDDASPRLAGGVLADLRNALANRGFVTAPDVALLRRADGQVVLQIAAGTVSTGAGAGSNHFFMIHDNAAFERWSQRQYDSTLPVTISQLQTAGAVTGNPNAAATAAPRGFVLDLGTDQVLAQSLTIAGKVLFTRVRSQQLLTSACGAALPADQTLLLASIRAADGAADSADLGRIVPGTHPANAAVSMLRLQPGGPAVCAVGDIAIAGCALSPRFTRRYWRREGLD